MSRSLQSVVAVALPCLMMLGSGTSARADFTGVFLTYHDFEPGHQTVRVHVFFDAPTDQLLAIGADDEISALVFAAGSPLVNFGGPFAGLKQEDFAAQPITGAADSYITLGADGFAGNDTDYSPGFLGGDGINSVIQGQSFMELDGGWYDTNPGTPVLAGAEGSVLIAQFTFGEFMPSYFFLKGVVTWQPAPGQLQSDFFQIGKPPAPPVAGLFAAAALVGRRRRR